MKRSQFWQTVFYITKGCFFHLSLWTGGWGVSKKTSQRRLLLSGILMHVGVCQAAKRRYIKAWKYELSMTHLGNERSFHRAEA